MKTIKNIMGETILKPEDWREELELEQRLANGKIDFDGPRRYRIKR